MYDTRRIRVGYAYDTRMKRVPYAFDTRIIRVSYVKIYASGTVPLNNNNNPLRAHGLQLTLLRGQPLLH